METPQAHPRVMQGVRRRDLLKTGLAAGLMLSASPLHRPLALCAAEAGQPKRGGILREVLFGDRLALRLGNVLVARPGGVEVRQPNSLSGRHAAGVDDLVDGRHGLSDLAFDGDARSPVGRIGNPSYTDVALMLHVKHPRAASVSSLLVC